mmetsp:Transcript_31578/g.46598  ORF Transcript_31578/g.46598 Transcript_31578/m.46598 type:complete len:386 (-) Transcript_31578:1059-2216(-)|eukprot:CAMPEP_0194206474 /NCGR_PEP_ID=MMETSP0156-20130528/5492_1 /TAXON_ID=33649 /ORGANISM="Thalassionema nitzschioides, Strain L26-B" /LENGTH=385 /DNA_ID=CAMNT_0038933005 /DNA_START=35 /DNA_END=1192 /DNA_ORIENTATION=-
MLCIQRVALTQSRRCFSTQLPRITERRSNEAGPGGRASDAGLKVAVFGATGFLGRYVCSELGTNGVLGYIANRGDEFEVRHIKTMFDLGRTRFVFYSPRDVDSMRNVIGDADIVINMIGKYYESKAPYQTKSFPYVGYKTNYSFEDANVMIPRTIAELCREMQVDNFIHVSSAAASPDSPSEWARTKYEGEEAVKEIYPWATIVRSTQLFGVEDRLLNYMAFMAAYYPVVPLIDGGHQLTQPVYAPDVAKTIARICDDPEKFEGKQVDCFGPSDYTYAELMEFVLDVTLIEDARVWNVPKQYAKMAAEVLQYQRDPPFTPDLVELMSEDYLPTMTADGYNNQKGADKIFTMEDLGVESTPIEKVAFNYLHRWRKGGHFTEATGYH